MTDDGKPHDPVPRSDASDLRLAIFRLSRRLRAERADEEVSDAQHALLITLMRSGPRTLTELAELERVRAPSMNRTVNGLEQRGYVTRSAHADDGRKVIIDITPAGTALIEETRRRRDAWLAEALSTLSPHQRDVLHEAMAILREEATR